MNNLILVNERVGCVLNDYFFNQGYTNSSLVSIFCMKNLVILFGVFFTVVILIITGKYLILNVDNIYYKRKVSRNLRKELNSFLFQLSLEGVNMNKDPLTYVLVQQIVSNQYTSLDLQTKNKHYKGVFRTPNATLSEYGKELVLARSITAGPVALGLAKAWIDNGQYAYDRGVMNLKPQGSLNPYDTLVVNKKFITLMYSLRNNHPAVQNVSNG